MADPRIAAQPRVGLRSPTGDDPLTSVPVRRVDDDKAALHVRLFGTHEFFRLWLAQVVAALGDWLGFLGITILAASVGLGGDGAASAGAAVGLVMIARIVPGFFLAPVAGVMVDRWDRKRVMVACNLGRAAVVATLPWVDSVLGLVVASFLLEVGALLFSPAKEASVPNLVPPDRLTTANSLSLVAAYGTFPIASLLFALLAGVAAWLGNIDALGFLELNRTALAFYIQGLTFVVSALLIATLPLWSPRVGVRPERDDDADGADDQPSRRIVWGATFRELKEGWRYVFINPIVRSVNVGLAIGLVGGGMVVPLGSVFSIAVLGAGAAGFGLFVTALGFGVAGGVIALSVLQSRIDKVRIFTLSLLVAGASLIGAASVSSLAPALALVFVLGTGAGGVYVLGFTLLHENTDDELRGRTFSALYTLVRLCLLIAFAVGPFMAELLDDLSARLFGDRRVEVFGVEVFLPGVRLTLFLAGLLVLAGGVVTGMSLRAGHIGRRADEATASESGE
ncbi:MAG: MFS transporter [Acidimicrobiales bacterium]